MNEPIDLFREYLDAAGGLSIDHGDVVDTHIVSGDDIGCDDEDYAFVVPKERLQRVAFERNQVTITTVQGSILTVLRYYV